MRLTLRNMLAYMDNLLDPDDRQEIGSRIEESEQASSLLHRIRDGMRRLRLGAPELMDRKHGLDPNTVAEYLDNTLADDRVPDFEKVCLDSDVHLAEVAACHQILTLVLGEPAEVNPESRVRMYHLPEAVSRRLPLENGSVAEVLGDLRLDTDIEPGVAHPKPSVPEYLRKSRRRRLASVAVAAATVLVVVVGYLAATDRLPLDALFGGPEPGQNDTGLILEPPQAAPRQPVGQSERTGATAAIAAQPQSAGPTVPATAAEPELPVPAGLPGTSNEVAVTVVPKEMAPGQDVRAVPSVPAVPIPLAIPLPTAPQPPIAPPGKNLVPAEPVGQLLTTEEPLVKLDRGLGQWRRLGPEVPAFAGEVLVGWPTFRPVLRLAGQLLVQPVDGCRFRLEGPDEGGVAGLIVESGQLVLRPADGVQQVSVRLEMAPLGGVLTLADSATLVALRVGRLAHGNRDPQTHPGEREAELDVISGKAFWQAGGQRESVSLAPPSRLSLSGQPAGVRPLDEIPAWIQHDTSSPLDQRASQSLRRALSPQRPLALREMAEHRQREVRWLAMRSLGWIGDFEPMAGALDVADYRAEWPDVIEHLRGAISRGPDDAAAVRQAMNRHYGADGLALYEMLWRYDVPTLDAADAARLVEWLDDDTLAVRVLAFWNLNRITGLGFFYRPEYTAAKRRQSVQRWRQRLLSNPTLGGRAAGRGDASPSPPDAEGLPPQP